MKQNRLLLSTAAIILIAATVFYASKQKKLFADSDTDVILSIGTKAPNFTLPSVTGSSVSLYTLKTKGVVVVFISTQCPVSNVYNSRMVQAAAAAKANGMAFIAINSNSTEDMAEVKTHATEKGFGFTVLKDDDNKVADLFGATKNPEVFLLGSDFVLLYHGRIDDNIKEPAVSRKDLNAALAEVAAGKPVTSKETDPVGCTIKRK
jgi:peroxiredoxin